ncbi:SURF1 family protein [Pseudemcibacter aquimaris]|uniref:SURF1 family protein n=1 Tax=Pseudemcibacter aquimaris TaxID=2857064 RepID=UPI002011E2D9|nr:SURF1 family protein [Pseudemcibacter aquimaris]MCC3862460.1 SURF1 family protein [Pseudemcibacter aquimaris]WDU59112.1 SURF1 family protein [Pseudemcibacter aquimaris]
MSSYTFKPRLWPTIITLPILVCLLLLGNWQVERLDWKLDLISKIEARATSEPVELPQGMADQDELEYLHVTVTGRYDNAAEVTMYSVGPNGEPGYDLYAPLKLTDGRSIIINRGWVPEQIKDQNVRPETLVDGEVTIIGLLRKPWEKLWYGPENDPAGNMWFYGDVNGMAMHMGINAYFPMFLYADKIDSDNGFPVAGRTEFNIVNNHLDYAMTWYGLSIVLIVIYLIAHIRKKEQ